MNKIDLARLHLLEHGFAEEDVDVCLAILVKQGLDGAVAVDEEELKKHFLDEEESSIKHRHSSPGSVSFLRAQSGDTVDNSRQSLLDRSRSVS